jgi:hypothetical protein
LHTHKKIYPRPVMAVLVSSKSISGLQNQIANPRIKLLVKANKEVNNILYFFSLGEVRLKEQKITGYYWHKTNKSGFVKIFHFLIFYISDAKLTKDILKLLQNCVTLLLRIMGN